MVGSYQMLLQFVMAHMFNDAVLCYIIVNYRSIHRKVLKAKEATED